VDKAVLNSEKDLSLLVIFFMFLLLFLSCLLCLPRYRIQHMVRLKLEQSYSG
jgi:hypothetical protein